MSKQDWVWQAHAGHFICGHDCRFRLNTYVNGYIISTVGELWPDFRVRQIHAHVRNIEIVGQGDAWDQDFMNKIGFITVGYDRLYETMVFHSKEKDENLCCPYRADHSKNELDFDSYNDAVDAYKGHMAMCEKWDNIKPEDLLHTK